MRWECTAAFGWPVLPEVYMSKARSSGPGAVGKVAASRGDGIHVGIGGNHPHLHGPLDTGHHFRDQFAVRLSDEDDFGVAMIQRIGQLRDAGANIQRHRDEPAIHRSQEQLRGPQAVVHEEGDLIAVSQARLPKTETEMNALLTQLAEGQRASGFGADEKGGLRPCLGHPIDQFTDRFDFALGSQ